MIKNIFSNSLKQDDQIICQTGLLKKEKNVANLGTSNRNTRSAENRMK
jgi:hypothetical protein